METPCTSDTMPVTVWKTRVTNEAMGPQGSEQVIKWLSNATGDTKEEAKGHV